MSKIIDWVYGVIADSTGNLYIVFFRSYDPGILKYTGVMARDWKGHVWHVTNAKAFGGLDQTVKLTLSRPKAERIEIELYRYWEIKDGACAHLFEIASSANDASAGFNPLLALEGMWIDLSAESIKEAEKIFRKPAL
jgi:hypothetical protein